MSARSKARHVQKSAREQGLEDSYQKIFQLIVHHTDEIHEYHQANPGMTWGEAADAIILPKLASK
jgi:hypothetical protein